MSNAYITVPKMQAESKTIHVGLHINLNYIIQYCISNQRYNKVVKVVIAVNDLLTQEINKVFL